MEMGKQPEIAESEIRLKLIWRKEKKSQYARRAVHGWEAKKNGRRGKKEERKQQ